MPYKVGVAEHVFVLDLEPEQSELRVQHFKLTGVVPHGVQSVVGYKQTILVHNLHMERPMTLLYSFIAQRMDHKGLLRLT